MAEDEKKKEEDFSYEGDIQPLMNQYFGVATNSQLSGDDQILFLRNQRDRLEGQAEKSLDLKLRGIAFEDAKLKIEENRKKSLNAREGMTSLVELQKALDFGITGVPADQQPTYFARVGVANAGFIGSNDAAKSAMSSALKVVTSSDSAQTGLENSILKGLDGVKFGEDYAGRPTANFANVGEKAAVEQVVTLFGTPEEQLQAAEMSAEELYGLAKKIRTRRYEGVLGLGTAPTTSSPRSLFSTTKAPTSVTPP